MRAGELSDARGVTGKVTGAAKPSGTHRHPPGIVTRAVAAAECRWLLGPATECYASTTRVAAIARVAGVSCPELTKKVTGTENTRALRATMRINTKSAVMSNA
jgi:hypothetical protein